MACGSMKRLSISPDVAARVVGCFAVQIAWTAFMSHMASSSSEEASPTAVKHAPVPRSKQLQQASR